MKLKVVVSGKRAAVAFVPVIILMPEVLNVPPATNNDNHPILREEVEAPVKTLK